MGALQRFEQRLEGLISGVFAKAFRSAVQPVEISAALQREVDNNAQILSRNRRLVPNEFHVELSDGDLDRLQAYDEAMSAEMTRALEDHAQQQSYVFPGPVSIAFESAEDLTTGRFRVRSSAKASVVAEDPRTRYRRTNAYLEVNGTRHPLQPPGLIVGRGTEAHLRINDPGVSRQHAEFTVSGGSQEVPRVEVRDLGSTNGVRVDGHKVSQVALRDGSVVTVGTTQLRLVIDQDETE